MPTRRRRCAGRWPQKIRDQVPGRIDYVVGPAVGGLIPAYETSRHLGVPAIWVERERGVFRLRRFEIEKGARVVIVEDIVTTGLSIRETIDACASLAPRCWRRPASSTARPARPMSACRWWRLPNTRCRPIRPTALPPELAAIPAVKPGSRNI